MHRQCLRNDPLAAFPFLPNRIVSETGFIVKPARRKNAWFLPHNEVSVVETHRVGESPSLRYTTPS